VRFSATLTHYPNNVTLSLSSDIFLDHEYGNRGSMKGTHFIFQ